MLNTCLKRRYCITSLLRSRIFVFVQTDKRTLLTLSKLSSSFDINNLYNYPNIYATPISVKSISTSTCCQLRFTILFFNFTFLLLQKTFQQHLSMGFSSFYFIFLYFLLQSAQSFYAAPLVANYWRLFALQGSTR